MNCPACTVPLLISERHGIEIDYCGQCRGVWLDRGELDKLIERAGARPSKDEEDGDDTPRENGRRVPGRHERENPLLDLFDFF